MRRDEPDAAPGDPASDSIAEEFSSTLEETRVTRLALNTLWDSLPVSLAADDTVSEALVKIHQHISGAEDAILRRSGHAEYYLIIRPISPTSPPSQEILGRITDAVRTLDEFGMLLKQHDALPRDGL